MLFEKIVLCHPLLHDFGSVCHVVSKFNDGARRYHLKYHYLPIKVTIIHKKQYQTLLSLSRNKNNKSDIYQEYFYIKLQILPINQSFNVMFQL